MMNVERWNELKAIQILLIDLLSKIQQFPSHCHRSTMTVTRQT